MSVACAVCQTLNRDGAMFCRGCAGKLPAFMATGPSALQLLEAERPRKKRRGASAEDRQHRSTPMAAAAFWMKWGVAMVALLLGFLAFYAYVTRKPPVDDAPSAASVATTAIAALPASAASPAAKSAAAAPTGATAPPAPGGSSATTDILARSSSPSPSVPIASTLDAGEVAIESKAANLPAPTTLASARPAHAGNPARLGSTSEFAPAPPPPTAQERSPAQRAPQPTRRDAMDPRRGCEGLSFIFAARCEAANCDKAAFTRHPRCDAVREERKRDEARRNPTLGF